MQPMHRHTGKFLWLLHDRQMKRIFKNLSDLPAENNTTLIPRTAGTSLAGQVVGNGIVVDVSKYFTEILEINTEEGYVRRAAGCCS